MINTIFRVLLYVLLCFSVGHVIAEGERSGQRTDDLTDFAPAQAQFFH